MVLISEGRDTFDERVEVSKVGWIQMLDWRKEVSGKNLNVGVSVAVQDVAGPYEVTLRVVLASLLLPLTDSNSGGRNLFQLTIRGYDASLH